MPALVARERLLQPLSGLSVAGDSKTRPAGPPKMRARRPIIRICAYYQNQVEIAHLLLCK
jgi:hypothetical protein